MSDVDTAVALHNVKVNYGEIVALDGATLAVRHGEMLAVLGPSGCGKTTLLRVVAGFEAPQSGAVIIEGATVAGPGIWVPPHRRGVGFVPQEGALFPHLNVGENIAFGLAHRRADGPRVRELAAMVGLSGLETRKPHELSGGQQQRVALARALAPRPAVVVLDEPFSALDAGLRAQLRADVRSALQAAGTTAILVTHDQDEALSLGDRVAVMREGRIVQVDTPANLYRQPVDLAVALFVGDAMVFDARVEGGRARYPLGEVATTARAEGEPVAIVVRPEHLRLGVLGLAATVIRIEYFGRDVRISMRTDNALDLVARCVLDRLPSPGDRVAVEVVGVPTVQSRP